MFRSARAYFRAHLLPLLGCVLALLVAGVPVVDVPRPGLDESWRAGLQMAKLASIGFGDPLVFTYGPLGFLDTPAFPEPGSVIALGVVSLLTTVGLYVALYRCFGSWGPPWVRVLVATTAIVALGPWLTASERLTVVCVLAGLKVLLSGHRGALLPSQILLASSAPLLLLAKASEGILVAGLATILVVASGRRAIIRGCALLIGAVVVFVVAWTVSGQEVSALPLWASGTWSIIEGYSGAMALEGSKVYWVVATYVVALVVVLRSVWLHLERFRVQRTPTAILPLVYVVIVVVFVTRQGFVRHDDSHGAMTFALCLALLVSAPRRGRPRLLDLSLVVASIWLGSPAALLLDVESVGVVAATIAFIILLGAVGVALLQHERAPSPRDWAVVVAGLSIPVLVTLMTFQPWRVATTAAGTVDPSRRASMVEQGQLSDQNIYAMSDMVRRSLEGRPVAVDPWEVSLAFAYGLQWDPLPVFQGYFAFTPYLDHLNADALLADPERVVVRQSPVRLIRPLDGRNPMWDSPRYNVALMCHYRPVASDDTWMSLARGSDRCGSPRELSTTTVAAGNTVELPPHSTDQVILATVTPNSSPVWRSAARVVLKDPQPLEISVDRAVYRLPAGLAGSPLVLTQPASLGWPSTFGGGQDATTISVSEDSQVTFSVIDVHS